LDGGVRVAHRLGRQAAACTVATPVGQQAHVQLVEVFGLELLQRDMPDVGRDVQPDVGLVGGSG